jgi:ABC-type nitrate/sulfonate/bicarbonate transport system permease component
VNKDTSQSGRNAVIEEIASAPIQSSDRSNEAATRFSRFKPLLAWARNWGASLLILAGLALLWEVWAQVGDVPEWQLPAPSAILEELVVSWGLLWENTLVTAQEVVLGFLAALVTGLLLAVAIAYSRILERSVYPIVIASQTIPVIAIAPLLLIWVGYGIAPKIIVVALISFFPISVNTVDGLKSADPDMVNMMRTLGASRWQIFTKLQIPASLPRMFSGIKIAIAVSVIGAVIGEWVGASAGLGYLMTYSQPLFLTSRVFAAILILSVMGVGLFLIASLVERLALPWYYTEKRARSLERI